MSLKPLLIALLFATSLLSVPSNFDQAKRLMVSVYDDSRTTFYCGCDFNWLGNKGAGRVDLQSCGYEVRRNQTRAERTEWEHVMPAHSFGHQRQCWQEGGRQNCRRDPVFRAMEADMHNLVPSIGEVNADRSNYRFGMLPSAPHQHGLCDFKVDFGQRVAQPRPEVRGDIARIYFYMHDRYNLNMSRAQEQLLLAWHKQDPVDAWETERDRRIARAMGHNNPFVTGEIEWRMGFKPRGFGVLVEAEPQPTAQSPQKAVSGPIRGNRNSMVYHRPDCPHYDRMAPRNIVEFETAEEAETAGYRVAGNCP